MRVTSDRVPTAAMLLVGRAALAQTERVLPRRRPARRRVRAGDPQGGDAVVVAQEPPAGTLVPPGGMVGFRTMTGLQPVWPAHASVPVQGVWAAVEVTVASTPV
jgi:hypothetical protein